MSDCAWPKGNEAMKLYHDTEWCVPSHDDTHIFEMLTLEGAQAGLSWSTVIAKREEYRRAFNYFDISYCAKLTDGDLQIIKERYEIIKNNAKINSVRTNASAVEKIQAEYGSFSDFLWSYVNGKPIINRWSAESQVPAQSTLSVQISKDLKRKGLKFVGPIIIYSFLQSIGIVDDHLITCAHHSLNR